MKKLFKERKLFKGENYMRKYGIQFWVVLRATAKLRPSAPRYAPVRPCAPQRAPTRPVVKKITKRHKVMIRGSFTL